MNRWLLALLLLLPLPLLAQRHELKREGRVLAHSLRYDPTQIREDMPAALQEMLSAYQQRPRYANRVTGRAVAPLLKSIRHQSDPYNRSCPYYKYDDGTISSTRCIVGCVATCIEQVVNYYHHPAALTDTLHGWQTDHYTIPDVLPGTPIDWSNILDDYSQGYTEAQAQAEADLAYYCGVASHMNWGVNSSGANLWQAFYPLYDAFDYKTIAYVQRGLYSNDAWNRMLRNELENGRPICYTGHNMALSGHAFNIDGVDEQGYYHLNWGYGGEYDGYYDLDYLNPFEPVDDATELGRNEGFFSNQTALFMHPEDFVIDITDTLSVDDAFHKVRMDTVTFRRTPDNKRYTVADFSMTNLSEDTLNFTFEVLTYLPSDTAIFMQADYVGISAVNLLPGEHKSWPVYCQFTETGDRIFAFSADDETLPYQRPITVAQGTASQLQFGSFSRKDTRYGDNLTTTLSIDIKNNAASGYAGDLLTFCLQPADSPSYLRHWQVLQLESGGETTSQVTFQHLTDGQEYEAYIRDASWKKQASYTFVYHADEAADNIQLISVQNSQKVYDLSGRQVLMPVRGLYIKNGKKIWLK